MLTEQGGKAGVKQQLLIMRGNQEQQHGRSIGRGPPTGRTGRPGESEKTDQLGDAGQ
jgi:hypothetical protein